MSLQSMDVSNEEIPNTLSATENLGAEKYDTSTFESNMIQQLQYVSWKYKNPYSISISNHMDYGKSTHALGEYITKQTYNNSVQYYFFIYQ